MTAVMATMAVSVSTASADGWTVYDPISGDPCSLSGGLAVNGSSVTGGCLVEDFAGGFRVSTPFQNWDYTSTFDMRVDSAGAFYAVSPSVSNLYGAPNGPCREYPSGAPLPWPGQIHAVGNGEYQADIDVCLTGTNGYSGTTVTITVDLAEFGVDGTSLVQADDSGVIRYAEWDSPNTFQIIED